MAEPVLTTMQPETGPTFEGAPTMANRSLAYRSWCDTCLGKPPNTVFSRDEAPTMADRSSTYRTRCTGPWRPRRIGHPLV